MQSRYSYDESYDSSDYYSSSASRREHHDYYRTRSCYYRNRDDPRNSYYHDREGRRSNYFYEREDRRSNYHFDRDAPRRYGGLSNYHHSYDREIRRREDSKEFRLPKEFDPPLTCFFWANTGYCSKTDEECWYAHYRTGTIASAPVSLGDGASVAGREAASRLAYINFCNDHTVRDRLDIIADKEASLARREKRVNELLANVLEKQTNERFATIAEKAEDRIAMMGERSAERIATIEKKIEHAGTKAGRVLDDVYISMYAFDHNYTELVKNLKERRTEVELALKEPKEQTFLQSILDAIDAVIDHAVATRDSFCTTADRVMKSVEPHKLVGSEHIFMAAANAGEATTGAQEMHCTSGKTKM